MAQKHKRDLGNIKDSHLTIVHKIKTMLDVEGHPDRDSTIASLSEVRTRIESVGNNAEQAALLIFLAKTYQRLEAYNEAIESFSRSLRLLRQVEDKTLRIGLWEDCGELLRMQTVESGMRQALNEYLSKARADKNKTYVAELLLVSGCADAHYGEYELAITSFMQASTLYEKQNDSHGVVRAMTELGNIYIELGDRDKGFEYLHDSCTLLSKLVITIGDIDSMEILQRHTPENCSIGDIVRQLVACKTDFSQGDSRSLAIRLRLALGTAHAQMGQYDAAQAEFKEALELSNLHMSFVLRANVRLQLGLLAEKTEQNISAIEYLQTALQFAERSQDRTLQRQILAALSAHYERKDDAKTALVYHREAYELRQRIRLEQSTRRMERYQSEYELEQAQRERDTVRSTLERLTNENEALRTMQDEYGKRRQQHRELLRMVKAAVREADSASDADFVAQARPFLQNIESLLTEEYHLAGDNESGRSDPQFEQRLQEQFPKLTATERKVCALLRQGIQGKQLAQRLHVSTRSVEAYRYRIRRKCGLEPEEDLTAFIKEL